jgi:hypothetical protein
VITAYFDDSGTHDASDIVLMAGVFGTEARLSGLEKNWRRHLEKPLDGQKNPLLRFHMTECQASTGEFSGWSRTETDYFCNQLATEITNSGVAAYGFACARKDWDDLVTGDVRAILGDPEGFCVRNCFVRSCGWAQANTFDPQMTFVFDDRPHRQRENRVVFDVYQRWVDPPPALVGISFLNSRKVPLLQVADMLAWELYRHANDILFAGEVFPPKRPQFKRLTDNMQFDAQIARRDRIQLVVDMANERTPEQLRGMAEHFMTFDPDAVFLFEQ